MAVLAGPPAEKERAIADALLDSLDEGNIQPPGDILLALSSFSNH
jgi:hypothetical protein